MTDMVSSTERQSLPISKDGLEAAFIAFGVVGTDAQNERLILKLMLAIEAYVLKAREQGL